MCQPTKKKHKFINSSRNLCNRFSSCSDNAVSPGYSEACRICRSVSWGVWWCSAQREYSAPPTFDCRKEGEVLTFITDVSGWTYISRIADQGNLHARSGYALEWKPSYRSALKSKFRSFSLETQKRAVEGRGHLQGRPGVSKWSTLMRSRIRIRIKLIRTV